MGTRSFRPIQNELIGPTVGKTIGYPSDSPDNNRG